MSDMLSEAGAVFAANPEHMRIALELDGDLVVCKACGATWKAGKAVPEKVSAGDGSCAKSEREIYGVGIAKGVRVELHPGCDLWMRGARYGVVRRVVHNTPPAAPVAFVRMDHKSIRKLQAFDVSRLRSLGDAAIAASQKELLKASLNHLKR